MRRARLVGRSFGRSLRRAAHNARRACSALSLAPSAPVAHTGAEGNALAAGQGCRTGSAPGQKAYHTTARLSRDGSILRAKSPPRATRALDRRPPVRMSKKKPKQLLIPLETTQGSLLKRCIIKPIARKKNLILALNCCAIRLDKTNKKWYYNAGRRQPSEKRKNRPRQRTETKGTFFKCTQKL